MKELVQETSAAQNAAPAAAKKKGGGLRAVWSNKKRRRWIILGAAVLAAGCWALRSCGQAPASAASAYTEEAAQYRAITQALSGSGTLQPADSYTVTTLREGEILAADFEEGDTVAKGTVLYQLDSADVSSNLEQAQRNYERAAYVKSPLSGVVAELNVKAGDVVSAGQTVAVVRDSSELTLRVPFAADDAANFSVGQSASVILDGSFETLTGRVTTVSAADTVLSGNRIVRYVTVTVDNPGGLTDTQAATAEIGGAGSSESATLEYNNAVTITASSGGTVSAVNVKEGASVSADQVLVSFTSNAVNDSVQQAADNLQKAEDTLDDYTITSPIDGTIVDKKVKAGEKVESGNTLCTIYDLEYLEMTLNVDELDVRKVSVGQSVTITADAVEGETFTGTVTRISMAGTTSGSATTYPVTVRIDDYGDLWPGMNVDAEIVVASSDNALSIPGAAVERGNRVLVTASSPSAADALDAPAPEGYAYVQVETGISDDDYIEITSGLQDGDTVAYIPASADGSDLMNMMMGGDMEGPPDGGPGDGGPGGGGPGGGPAQ